MFHPFIDASSLSDEDLMIKLNDLYVRLAHCESHGQHQAAQELKYIIASLENEQGERSFKYVEEELIRNSKDSKDNKGNKNKKSSKYSRNNTHNRLVDFPITLGKIKDKNDGTDT